MLFINGAPAASIIRAEQLTVYVSPFITVNGNRFTKHYYAGAKRIVSKIGNGQFNNKYAPGTHNILAGNVNAIERYNQIEGSKVEYIRQLGVPPGPPTMKGIYGEPEFTGNIIPDGGTPTAAVPANWPRKPIQAPPGCPPGAPIQFGQDITNETVEGGFGFITTGHIEETDQYFYHSDHLGSSAYITDKKGKVSQFVVYLPFGESLIDKHVSPDVMPYKFNGKEKDEETGLYYYGARYYNGNDQVWMGVDPMWEKYPEMSPYIYCANNPVNRIDPTGMDDYYYNEKGKQIYRTEDKEPDKNFVIKTTQTTSEMYPKKSAQNGKTQSITSEAAASTENEISSGNLIGDHMKNITQIASSDKMDAMIKSIKDDGSGGTGAANNREYSGKFGGKNGVYNTAKSKSGKPSEGKPLVTIGDTDFHSHPSGTEEFKIKGESYTGSWQQPPSKQDISVAGNKNQYVVGMRNGTIYIYNKNGVIATIPVSTFK